MKTKILTLAMLCYVSSISMSLLHAQDCTVFAGQDTLICDYSYELIGMPEGGTWELICDESVGTVAFEPSNTSNTLARVSGCGLYTFVYNIDLPGCMGTDTVLIEFDSPNFLSVFSTGHSMIEYTDVECHESPPVTCDPVVTIGGGSVEGGSGSPYMLQWSFSSQSSYSYTYYEQIVDTSLIGCIADTITTDTSNISGQSDLITQTYNQNEVLEDYFDIVDDILSNSSSSLDDIWTSTDSCGGLGDCRDSLLYSYQDTLIKVIPYRTGGSWYYQNENGNYIPMDDTTFYSQGEHNFAIVLEIGPHYYGPNTQDATFYSVDENGNLIQLANGSIVPIQWQDTWEFRTITRIRTIYETQSLGYCCPSSSSGTSFTDIGTPPPPPCSPIILEVKVPPEYDDQFYAICEDECIGLFTDAPSTASVTWEGAGGFPNGNGWEACGFDLGFGTHEFIATITDDDCISEQRFLVDVFPNYPTNLDNFGPFCETDSPIELPQVQNGVFGFWSGDGVSGNIFNPAGQVGTAFLTFTPDFGQCASPEQTIIEVYESVFAIFSDTDIVTCNTSADGSTVDFASLIIGGDASGTWSDSNGTGVDLSNPNNVDFDGIMAGNYTFTYTTNSAVSPCVDPSYEINISVELCPTCPNVDTDTPPNLYNTDGILDLTSLEETTEAGTWSLTGIPPNTINPVTITGNTCSAIGASAGDYEITFTLDNTPPIGCPPSSSQILRVLEILEDVDAGPDTLICGLSYQLIGSPEDGNWDILCPPSDGVVAFENQDTSTTWVTVSNCGDYTFIYMADGENGTARDTVIVTFDVQPSSQSIANLDISLEYNDINCHSPASDCSNMLTIQGFEPPSVSWEFCMSNTCSSQIIEAIIGNSIGDCLVDSIQVDTIRDGITLSDCSSPTEVNGGTFLDILDNLADGLGCPLPPPSDCLIDRPECPDTLIFDTITLYIPIHEGGQWHYLNDNDNLEALMDTSSIVIDEMDYQFIIDPSSDYYGPGDLTFTIFELDVNNNPIDLTQNVEMTIQWQELWSTDTLVVVDSFYVALEDTCYACGGHVAFPAVIDIPPPPSYPCGPLDLNFSVPPSDIFESYFLSCDEFCVLTSAGEICGPGTYDFEEIDANGCTYSIIIDIFMDFETPIADIFQLGTMTCDNPAVTLDASASSTGPEYIYEWFTPNGNTISGQNELVITVDIPGIYTLSVFNTNNGCESTATINVQDETIPSPISMEIFIDCNSPDELIQVCPGTFVSISDISNPYPCQDENGCPTELTVIINADMSAPVIDQVQTICNENNTAYTVLFDVSGTDDYTIAGNTDDIPSCENYEFTITNNLNGCSTTIGGTHCCECISQAGEFAETSISSCNDCVTATYLEDTQTLDDNDLVIFLLHTEAAPAMGDILASNDEATFCFEEGTMSFDTPYYITAQVGNNDGNNSISPDDNCAALSNSLSVTWPQIASFTEVNEQICAGNCLVYNDSTLCEPGIYQFTLQNNEGCDSMVMLTLSPTAEMLFDWSSEAACFNDNNGQIFIENVTGGMPPYLYSTDGENFQTEANFSNLSAGAHLIYVQDSEGCMIELGLDIPEIPAITAVADTTAHICSSESILLNATPAHIDPLAVSYQWQDGSTKATFTAPIANDYWVDISTACQTIRQEFRVVNDFVPAEQRIYVPNAFSPNGDEENDFFKPLTNLELTNYEFYVFDRWGNLLFSAEDIDAAWDGRLEQKSMKPAVMGWWLRAEVMTCTGQMESVFMKGDVTVVR